MAFIDLKSVVRKWEVPSDLKKERAHEFREDYFLAADGFSLPLRVSPVRASVQRQFQNQESCVCDSDRKHIRFLKKRGRRYKVGGARNDSPYKTEHQKQSETVCI